MISLFSILAIGFFLGMRHATDPDHVIAVTTIVSSQRNPWRAALVGAFWGVGHTLTIVAVGSAIILFNLVVPTRLGLTMELGVGFMLIVLGLWTLADFRHIPTTAHAASSDDVLIHSHPHRHGVHVHTHPHAHTTEAHSHPAERSLISRFDRIFGAMKSYRALRSLIVGAVHGLAGSAAISLLVLATIPNPRWAIAYLLVFGVGTIAGMMLITTSIASAFGMVGTRSAWFSRRLGIASGLISVAFGAFLTYQICVVQGLLTIHPKWIPH